MSDIPCQSGNILAQGFHAGSHMFDHTVFFGIGRRVGIGKFAPQSDAPRTESCQSLDLVGLQIVANFVALFGKSDEAARRDRFHFLSLRGERGDGVIDTLAQGTDLPLARLAEDVEALEPCNDRAELVLRRAAYPADLVGDILGRVCDDRQVRPQALHVFPRGETGAGNGIDLFSVIANKPLQTIGMFGNLFRRAAPQIFEIAGLVAEKFARKAQFAVHGDEPVFQQRRFIRKRSRHFAIAPCFAGRGARLQDP